MLVGLKSKVQYARFDWNLALVWKQKSKYKMNLRSLFFGARVEILMAMADGLMIRIECSIG